MLIEMRSTREATDIFFGLPPDDNPLVFEKKTYYVETRFSAKPFVTSRTINALQIWDILTGLTKIEQQRKDDERNTAFVKPSRSPKSSWQAAVNRRRRLVASCIARQTTANLTDICRFTGCSFQAAKKVQHDMLFSGQPEVFVYPNLKTEDQVSRLSQAIDKVQGSFQTVSDLKRDHPDFSKRWIARRLKLAGYRYRLLPKRRKNPKKNELCSKKVIELISHITTVLSSTATQADMLYIDEVHFPLVQTAERYWVKPDDTGEPLVYNRRAVPETKLSVIAACSLTCFVAVQVFQRDVTADDFLFFLQKLVQSRPRAAKVCILADNASWHTCNSISGSRAGKFLFFNIPGMFRTNAIENSFSFVRSEFRKRPTFETPEQEAAKLVQIFFMPENLRRFRGIHRNHLRSLRQVLEQYSPLLAGMGPALLD
jgi:hypothetical protein